MKMMFVCAVALLLFACKKDQAPNNIPKGSDLTFVKAAFNGTSVVQNEYIYHTDGKIKTRIDYKNYSSRLVGAKTEYIYSNGKLTGTESEMDFSASSSGVQYVYNRANFEYNSSGWIIQRKNSTKRNDVYELSSFSVFSYNDKGLPIKETRYQPDGALYGYSNYTYDANGNVTSSEDYGLNQNGVAVLSFKKTYQYDGKKNPYKSVYHTVENIPFSVNQNNITHTVSVNYAINTQGISTTAITQYPAYNTADYPLSMDENGNAFELEYK